MKVAQVKQPEMTLLERPASPRCRVPWRRLSRRIRPCKSWTTYPLCCACVSEQTYSAPAVCTRHVMSRLTSPRLASPRLASPRYIVLLFGGAGETDALIHTTVSAITPSNQHTHASCAHRYSIRFALSDLQTRLAAGSQPLDTLAERGRLRKMLGDLHGQVRSLQCVPHVCAQCGVPSVVGQFATLADLRALYCRCTTTRRVKFCTPKSTHCPRGTWWTTPRSAAASSKRVAPSLSRACN